MTQDELCKLIEKYLDGMASEVEKARLQNWYHRQNQEETIWATDNPDEEALIKKRLLSKLPASEQAVISGNRRAARRKRGYYIAAAASLALLCCLAIGFFLKRDRSETPYVTITNPSGQIRKVWLPDSSLVWMNAESVLRYPEGFGQQRKIELEGEAFFDVKKDVRPFIVSTPSVKVRVLGTAFGVQAYQENDQVDVVVERGSVGVDDQQGRSLGVLLPDQRMGYDKHTGEVRMERVNAARHLSWKDGKLAFESQNLGEIARTLEKWYGIKIEFLNNDLKDCLYQATFDNTIQLEELLSLLCEINDIRFRIEEGRQVKLWGKGCVN